MLAHLMGNWRRPLRSIGKCLRRLTPPTPPEQYRCTFSSAMTTARPVLPSGEWDYLDVDVLRPACSGAVCITCQHFRYEVGRRCVTVLTCPIHQGLIPQFRDACGHCR